jgi:xylan 1,4-beta-xylosidase
VNFVRHAYTSGPSQKVPFGMGRAASPTERQIDRLRELAQPYRRHGRLTVDGGRAELWLERHEVTLVEIEPVTDESAPWQDDARLLGREAP